MSWLTKPSRFSLDVTVSCLRLEMDKLARVIKTIEQARDYDEEYICESIKSIEIGLRSVRKSIKENI